MTKLHTLLLLPLGLLFTACVGQTWRVDAGPMFLRARGEVALQNSAGNLSLGANQNSLQGDLGLGDTEPSPYVRAQMDSGRHRARLHAFGVDAEGSGVLNSDFGGIVAGSQVTTSMDLLAITGNYGYEVLREKNYRVALGGQIGFYSLDVAARSTLGREVVNTDVLLPMPFAEVEGLFGPLTVGFSGAIMGIDAGDASGRYWDLEAYARYQATEQFELIGGYRYVLLDAYGTASSRDFDADVDVQGLFFGAGIKF